MELCEELKTLSKEFISKGHKLYIVGGFVRDNIMGFTSDDIDITSSMPVESVEEICKKLRLKTTNINKTLGTILIIFNGIHLEYTRLRTESYSVSGQHTPDTVEFVDDINIDCLRRDFTINSIYYDIEEGKFADPVNGIQDINEKIIKTTQAASITLADDGLRILRAIRFSATLGFQIEKKTYTTLRNFSALLNKISKERILRELEQIVVADYKHNKKTPVFLQACNDFSLLNYIFNSTINNTKKFSKKDINRFYGLSEVSRLIGFYVLVLKNYFQGYIQYNQLGYSINSILGLDGLKESTSRISTVEKIYRVYENIEYSIDLLNAAINYLAFSDSEREIIDAYLSDKATERLSATISQVKAYNLPLSIHQLDITAQDLIDLGIDRKFISKILSILYNQVLQMAVKNQCSDLKNLALEIHNTFRKL